MTHPIPLPPCPVPVLGATLMVALLAFGCSDDGGRNNVGNFTVIPKTTIPKTVNTNNTATPTSPETSGTTATATTTATTFVPSKTFCRNFTDKGVVDAVVTTELVFEGDTTAEGLRSGYDFTCGGGGSAIEQGFYFKATDDMIVEVIPSSQSPGVEWAVDVNKGSCEDYVSVTAGGVEKNGCQKSGSLSTGLLKGETLFVAAESRRRNTFGRFTLTLKFTPVVCRPVGQQACNGPQVKRCENGGQFESNLQCTEGCQDDACIADVCATAKTWTRDELLAEAKTFTGSSAGYRDTVNFRTATACKNPDSEVIPPDPNDPDANPNPPKPGEMFKGISTPGQDTVFKLTGLKKGDLLTVSENGENTDAVVAVLDTCELSTCHVAIDLGDQLVDWSVPKDGDYTVVVDRTVFNTRGIAVTIGLKKP